MIPCMLHDDPESSLAVYKDHLFCFGGCGYFRRYEGAALLLGVWDGKPETVNVALGKVMDGLDKYQQAGLSSGHRREKKAKPLSPFTALSFHRFLLSMEDTLQYFLDWRGMTLETVIDRQFGYTGTHFSIPVFDEQGVLLGIRYRNDDRQFKDVSKYQGNYGNNATNLYDMRLLCRMGNMDELWVFEGEYDAAIGSQLGVHSVTTTNGAGRLERLPGLVHAMGLNPKTWILASDQDEAGDKAAYQLAEALGGNFRRALWDGGKDITEYNKRGGRISDIYLTNPGVIW